ncbi:MAG TPA: MliC family protein [Candidatus Dormibacteraeota bacterium]|jgi:membrane-bound inhibitor of C-type lysozyme|nr:MliC family protein [Candidatus Dormibacteraeota bacterium]
MGSKSWATAVTRTSIAYGAFVLSLLITPSLRAQQPSPDPGPIPPPSQPAPNSPNAPTAPVAPANPPAGASPSSHMMRTWRRLTYTCDGDVMVVVNLHAKQARVVFKGHTYNLQQTDESDGQKYTDGAVVWRNKDEVGTLERASKSGHNKSLAAGCLLQSAGTEPTRPPPSHQ